MTTATPLISRYATGTRWVGHWSTLAIGGSIPISIAFDNILLALMLATWLIGLQYLEKLLLFWHNPVYRAALLLFSLLLLGTLYSSAAPGDARLYLSKYRDLALIPVLGWAFIEARARGVALRILAGGLALVVLLSYAMKTGLVPANPWMHGTAESPVVFKQRLTHNILMAYGAFLFAWLACSAASRRAKLFWGTLGALTVANIMLLVDGVTGYILLVTLVLLFGWQRARLRGIGIAIATAFVIVAGLSAVPGPFQTRIKQIYSELKKERVDFPASTSTGYRLEFYRNTLSLIEENPVFGKGTGSFPAIYAELVGGSGKVLSRNPHNEFMLITAQIGLVGLAAFIWLLWQQWRYAPQLPTPIERGLAQGLVLMMGIICMLNSSLLDHTEGLLYAWLTALLYAGLESDDRVIR